MDTSNVVPSPFVKVIFEPSADAVIRFLVAYEDDIAYEEETTLPDP